MGKKCSVEGCGRAHQGKGFCSKHYMINYRKGVVGKGDMCKVDGCNSVSTTHGMCDRHYQHIRLYGKIPSRTTMDANAFVVEKDTCRIALFDKKREVVAEAIIDTADLPKVRGYKWWKDSYDSVCTHMGNHTIVLARHLLKPPGRLQIDHINRDKLDNRRSNLRICELHQNSCNRPKQVNNTSGYKGVSWDRARLKWVAGIMVRQKRIYLGGYEAKEDAALAYNEAALKFHGEFACINEVGA